MLPTVHRIQVVAILLAAVCAIITLLRTSADAREEAIRVQGSTTFTAEILAHYQGAVELATGQELNVVPNKSTPGLIALLENKADLAMISTTLKSAITSAQKTHPDLPYDRLQAFSITRTRVALAVHPSNPVRTVSLDTLRGVLRGTIVNWSELGGMDLPIRLVMVRNGGGVKLTVENELLGGDLITANNSIPVSNGERIVRVVEQETGALGVMQFNLLHRHSLPELQLDQVILQELNFITFGHPTPTLKAVIDATREVASSRFD